LELVTGPALGSSAKKGAGVGLLGWVYLWSYGLTRDVWFGFSTAWIGLAWALSLVVGINTRSGSPLPL
jgi:hypothetical protein